MTYLGEEVHSELTALRAHYDSWRGWVGRNSWYILPAVFAAGWAIGYLWR